MDAPMEAGPAVRRQHRWLALLIAGLALSTAWRAAMMSPGIDFYQYWVVGEVLSERRSSDLYDLEVGDELGLSFQLRAKDPDGPRRLLEASRPRRVIEVYSTPFLYAAASLLVSGDYERDYRVFHLLALLAGALGVVLLCRALGHGFTTTCLWLALLSVVFAPTLSDVRVGNVNRFLLLWLAAFLVLQRSARAAPAQVASGAILGMAVAFKPLLLFPVFLLAFSRVCDRRLPRLAAEGAGAVLGVAAAVLFSAWRFGSPAPWLHWTGAMRRLMGDFPLPLEAGNNAFAQILLETAGADVSSWLPLAVVLMSGGAVWAARGRLRGAAGAGTPERDTLVMGLGCAAVLLFSKLAWNHYFLLTAPLLIATLSPRPEAREPSTRSLGVAALAYVMISQVPRLVVGANDPVAAAGLASAGAALLAWLAVVQLLRSRGEPGPLAAP
jgi:hypothetical protein